MARRKSAFDPEAAEGMSAKELSAWLDERQRRFCEEYNVDLNGTEAAVRAGYKPGKEKSSAAVMASKLLRDPRVRAFRAALIRERVEDQTPTREHIELRLMEIYRRCMQAEPVKVWDAEQKAWVESGVWRFDARGAMKALEQLSRLLGLDVPERVELTGGALEAFLREQEATRAER